VMELKQALETDDLGEIRAKTDALQEASHKLSDAVYAQAQAQQAQASGGNGSSEDSDEEVIEDAEVVDEEAKTS
jgi:molecular chaperone DnaK